MIQFVNKIVRKLSNLVQDKSNTKREIKETMKIRSLMNILVTYEMFTALNTEKILPESRVTKKERERKLLRRRELRKIDNMRKKFS